MTEPVLPAESERVCRCPNGPTAPLWASKWDGRCLVCKGTHCEFEEAHSDGET